mmetsp:Transcript_13315/g.18267  ORF Transcript_13315/g.18267 Transcript_13315/m.18267 type:complete len:228 (-) Transcript_13315:159-842(-)
MAEILEKSGKGLLECIKEMEQREEHRINRLQKLTSAVNERGILLKRYEKERYQDQLKISNLTEEFRLLKTKFKNGELQELVQHRMNPEERAQSSRRNKDEERNKLNRFAGLENRDQMLFRANIFNKFEQHDLKFQKKNSQVQFNPREEYHKLKLLNDKKEVLTKLIDLQSSDRETHRNQHYHNRPFSSAASTTSGRSSNGESWATFGTSATIPIHKPKQNVPTLKLS